MDPIQQQRSEASSAKIRDVRQSYLIGLLLSTLRCHGSTIAMMTWITACFAVTIQAIPLPNLACPQDLGVMVDAGYRFYQGLRPHADYHSALGPVLGMVFGVPMVLFGPSYESLRYLPPAISLVTLCWAWLVCRRSLPAWAASLTATTIAGVSGGIYHQGFPPEALTFATFYNRLGFGVLGIVALAALLPRQQDTAGHRISDASIISGFAILTFLKANYAVFAIPFIVIAVLLHRRPKSEYRILAAIIAVVAAFFLYQIGFRVDRMIGDLMMAATARKQGAAQVFFPLRNLLANHDLLIVMAFPSVMISILASTWSPGRQWFHISLIWGPAILGWTLTLMQSHGDGKGVPLVICGLVASYAWLSLLFRAAPWESPASGRLADPLTIVQGISAAAIVCCSLLFLVPHAYSYYVWHIVSHNTGPRQFAAPPIRDLYVGGFTNTLGENCISKINEGTDLVRRHASGAQTFQFIGSSNLFTFACGLRSPRNSMLYWDSISTYSQAWYPPTSDLAATEFVLVPKNNFAFNDDTPQWFSVYGYYLAEKYELLEETTVFRLYRRKPADVNR